jgi:GNAT superfamily N-acetyltransferase
METGFRSPTAGDEARLAALCGELGYPSSGAALLAQAEEWARKRNVRTIRLRSNVVRERAHLFYLGEGYERIKTSHVFQKELR